MPGRPVSARTRLKRHPERGAFDRATIDAILDEALVCHVGFVEDGTPVVVPTVHARVGDVVYLHGSPASRMLTTLAGGCELCLTVTLVDGLVLARSAFDHSVNYRSVMAFGKARLVTDAAEKLAALEAVTEHMVPGRWAELRPPNGRELDATIVLAVPLDEASAKVRSGPPADDSAREGTDVWAGVVPLVLDAGRPEPAAGVPAGLAPPAYLGALTRPVQEDGERS
ncbi:MAG TPA: pyridoxamine 5'-phosphate oxidase family protein [Trueperaceae bacterium]|nr:pyridoxamine 5'-phosphate oxidase family protein [Trueperaceae bacterium]